MWVNCQLLAVCTEAAYWGTPIVAVNSIQLRTMASETVDPIDWSHLPPSWAVPHERLVHSINQCNLSRNRTRNRSMRGNHLAYAPTQGIAATQGIITRSSDSFSTVPLTVNRGDWGCIVRDLETIIVMIRRISDFTIINLFHITRIEITLNLL